MGNPEPSILPVAIFGTIISTVPAVILTVLICGIRSLALKGRYGQKLLERAKKRGYMVTAEKCADGKQAVYQYAWKERIYRCRPIGKKQEQPQTVELFFLRSPAKACTAEKLGRFRTWLVFLCCELILAAAVSWYLYEKLMQLLGGICGFPGGYVF